MTVPSIARPACGLILVMWVAACGATDDSAPIVTDRDACTSMDEHLAPLRHRIETGGLDQIGKILEEELDPASLQAIVQLALDIARDLPAGTLQQMTGLLEHPQAGRMVPIVVALLEPLPGDAKAQPPVPAKGAELLVFSRIATTCLEAPLFAALTELLRDKRLGPALAQLLGDSEAAREARKTLRTAGKESKAGFVKLLENLALSIAEPDFDPDPLVALLQGLAGDQPGLLAGARDLFVVATLNPDGSVATARVNAISNTMKCFLDIDQDFILPAYWTDILLSPDVSAALAGPPGSPPLDVTPIVELAVVGAWVTEALAQSEAARDALGQVLGLLLRPDLSVRGIPELVDLLEGDALPGMVRLISDLSTQPCLPQGAR